MTMFRLSQKQNTSAQGVTVNPYWQQQTVYHEGGFKTNVPFNFL